MQGRGWRTRRKLEEAKFFLEQLQLNYGKEKKFDFFLSAFISAARSVTWVMGSEYADTPGWREWFKELTPSDDEARLLAGTNALRIRTQKIDSPNTMTRVMIAGVDFSGQEQSVVEAVHERSALGTLQARVSGVNGKYVVEITLDGRTVSLPATSVFIERNLDEFPGESIIDICTKYYGSVHSVVTKCGEKFDT